jgi:TRAP-type C4-dicarboxylate transport system permease small subunit
LEKAGRWAEDFVLVVILTTMILLAASQIVMRNFFDFGFIWADELLRMLVLWIAVAGAVAASRTDKQINTGICLIITWYSIDFVRTSYEYGDVLLGKVPAWILQLVLPIGFGLIAWRYLLFCFKYLLSLFKQEPAS